jgi:hypothetical protein
MRLFIVTLLLALNLPALANEGNFLNVFVLTAPPKYLADVPAAQRASLMLYVSQVDGLLDYPNKWLWFATDSTDVPMGSSMFWIKLLPRGGGWDPFVLVYMSKPFNRGGLPSNNQTYILENKGINGWRDVTTQLIPKNVDITMAFIPLRSGEDIQVAGYRQIPGLKNRKGEPGYDFGTCRLILHWNGTSFVERTIEPRKVVLGG